MQGQYERHAGVSCTLHSTRNKVLSSRERSSYSVSSRPPPVNPADRPVMREIPRRPLPLGPGELDHLAPPGPQGLGRRQVKVVIPAAEHTRYDAMGLSIILISEPRHRHAKVPALGAVHVVSDEITML